MNTLKTLPVILVSFVMAACAATPKPELSVMQYQSAANGMHVIDTCIASGKMSPEIGALGETYLKGMVKQYSFDITRLVAATEFLKDTLVTSEECNRAAMQITQRKQQIDINNQNNQMAVDQLNSLNNQRTTNTYCNKIGTQLFCNTY